MAKSLYQPFYWDDYFLATPDLDLQGHGAYLCLIGLYWQNGGPLPNDMPKLCRILRATTRREADALKSILQKHFTLNSEGAWVHDRIERDIEKLQHYRNEQAKKSEKAAAARAAKKATDTPADISTDSPTEQSTGHPEAHPEGGEAKAKAKRVSKRNSETPQPPRGEVEATTPFDDFWQGYPVSRRINKRRCVEIWRVRKLDAHREAVVAGLKAWCQSEQWLKNGGQYIPYPQKFLNEERWQTPPTSNGPVAGGGMAALAANTIIKSREGEK